MSILQRLFGSSTLEILEHFERQRQAREWHWTEPDTSKAIPPAYTHYIGLQLINYLNNKRTPIEPEFNWKEAI